VGGGQATFDEKIAKLSVVGVGMKTHSGVAATLFRSPGEGRHQPRADQHLRNQDLRRDRRRTRPTKPRGSLHAAFEPGEALTESSE
jgi:hypothetical protein